MFKYGLLFVAAGVLSYNDVSPVVSAVMLTLIALGAVDDLGKKLRGAEKAIGPVDRMTQELSDIKRELSDVQKELVQGSKAAARLEWLLSNRIEASEAQQLAEDVASALCRLDSLEAEIGLRRTHSMAS
ncbi:hypothetical protein [Rhodopseudomonas pseudopalustris]|uniref:Uncharacterized protein n=1 Tax=Rhodopseudomonas pseudopalustris TaxID=1513892 RepID=A0A1H8NCJ5_9BRAD|nr:hypothetical protein [Rhodopseudomonas pseudopalustris]SEO27143.1 hypothetical protein SAMN05444123_10229 [Rhodopseudomonas pseudopalustris]